MSELRSIDSAPPRIALEFAEESDAKRTADFLREWIAIFRKREKGHMERVIIYARVSTEDQSEKYGLPSQLRSCREYAAARNWAIVAEICDEGISGAVLDRPGLERVRQMARDRAADVILMLDPDRLSRELGDLLFLKPEIEKNARLEFVTVVFENTPTGALFFSMKGAIAQYERAVTRDRTMRGKRERARTGRQVGGRVPFGYRSEDGLLAADEESAAIVRSMFDAYAAGLSIRHLARRLREQGVPTWGGGAWGHSSVRRILCSETYVGVAHWGKPERFALAVPAIVERGLWQRVQARLRQNPYVGRPTATYLLRGLLFCSCGTKMYGERLARGNRVYRSYRCHGGRDKIQFAGCSIRISRRIGWRSSGAIARRSASGRRSKRRSRPLSARRPRMRSTGSRTRLDCFSGNCRYWSSRSCGRSSSGGC